MTLASVSRSLPSAAALVAVLGAGCVPPPWSRADASVPAPADAGPRTCGVAYPGDPASTPTLQLITTLSDGGVVPLEDGGRLAILEPPQGGRVAFVGVRVRHLDPCGIMLSGGVRDPVSGQLRVDNRSTNLRAVDGGDVASYPTSISTFANIPLCPNQWATTDVFDHPFTLEFSVTDRAGKMVQQVMQVTPYCAEADKEEECLCQCRAGYRLGDTCRDGGVSAPDGG